MTNLRSKILGVGSYTPPDLVTNTDLQKYMDTSDEWIQQRTGIKQRYWVKESVSTSDLALEAAKNALDQAGIKKEELDLIILGTLSPDANFPGTACYLQAKLDVPGIPAIDIRQQCTSFIYGMSLADAMIRTGQYKRAMVVGAEVHSKALDISTRGREVSVLFGDGAGAVIMGPTEVRDPKKDAHLLSTHLHADGRFAGELKIQRPGTAAKRWISPEDDFNDVEFYPEMNGKAVFMHAAKRMPETLVEALKANELQPSDIDLFVFHQANKRINDMCAKQLGVPEEKVFDTIDRFGNTTAATIPIGLNEAVKAGKLKPGMLVASAAFGSGFTWASAIYRW